MNDSPNVFRGALSQLLREIFSGPPGDYAFVLNPGDPGLLAQLDGIDAQTASRRAMPGKTTIAAHVDHVLYGLELLNRWSAGEENPWATADWNLSWQRGVVNDEQWNDLRQRLKAAAGAWSAAVAARDQWDELAATGSLASAVHTAYHLGAIRQILAASAR